LPGPVLFLKALVRGHTRRGQGGRPVIVRPYSAARAAAAARQADLFSQPRPAAAPAAPPPPAELNSRAAAAPPEEPEGRRGQYTGWQLEPGSRQALLDLFPPAYPQVVAHHVTHSFPAAPGEGPPPPAQAEVVGVADDGRGVQALVVAIDGSTARPDGSTYHVTWSLEPGRKAMESNQVVATGWHQVEPVPIGVTPQVFERSAPPAPRPAEPSDDQAAALHDPGQEGLTGHTCLFCGQPERIALHEVWGHDFMLDTCCPDLLEEVGRSMEEEPGFSDWLASHIELEGLTGGQARRLVTEEDGHPIVDWHPQVKPISRKEAQDFIATWHRHNKPLPGDVFRAGVWNGPTLLGVVVVGIPTAQAYMPAFKTKDLVEVRRVAIRTDLPRELTWKAASTLYRHAAEEAERRGFRRIITYTLKDQETGMSLRYARWKPEAETAGGSWNRPSRPRADSAPTSAKVRWTKQLRPLS